MGLDYKKKYLKYKNKYLEAKKIYGGSNPRSEPLKKANSWSHFTKEELDARDVVVDSNENATLLSTAIEKLKKVDIKTSMIEKLLDDYDKCKKEDKDKKDKIAQMVQEEYIKTFPEKNDEIKAAKSTEEIIEVIIKHAIELNKTDSEPPKDPASALAPATATAPAVGPSGSPPPADAPQASASAKPLTFDEINEMDDNEFQKKSASDFAMLKPEDVNQIVIKKRGEVITKLPVDSEVRSNILTKTVMDKDALNELIDNTDSAQTKAHLLELWVEINNGMEQLKADKTFLSNEKTEWFLVKKALKTDNQELLTYMNTIFPAPK